MSLSSQQAEPMSWFSPFSSSGGKWAVCLPHTGSGALVPQRCAEEEQLVAVRGDKGGVSAAGKHVVLFQNGGEVAIFIAGNIEGMSCCPGRGGVCGILVIGIDHQPVPHGADKGIVAGKGQGEGLPV